MRCTHLEGKGADTRVPSLVAASYRYCINAGTRRPGGECHQQLPWSAIIATRQKGSHVGVYGSQVQHGGHGGGAKTRHHCHHAHYTRPRLTVPRPRLDRCQFQRLP